MKLIESRKWIFFYVALNMLSKLWMRFSRNHVFEVAVVQNSHTNNPIDLKCDTCMFELSVAIAWNKDFMITRIVFLIYNEKAQKFQQKTVFTNVI